MKKYTVYIIRHISTGTVLYVGKTNDFKRRAYEHLKLNTNSKDWLSVIGTGNVFIEAVAEFENKDDALKYEDELILKYNTIENGYNNNRSGLITYENHKKYNREYSKTDKFKEYHRKWQREYSKTDKCRKYQRDYHRKYEKTDKRIEYQKEYRNSEKYKEYRREYDRERSKTEKRKEYQKKYQKNYQIDYYKAKKLGIKIDDYRKFEQNKKQPIQLTINFS